MLKKPIRLSRKAWGNRAVKAREKLVADHAPRVRQIAEQVHRTLTHVDPEDLEQAGFIGLMEAADRHQPGKGSFEAFSFFRIRGAMIDAHKRSAYRDDTHASLEETVFKSNYGGSSEEFPLYVPIDNRPLADAMAARREQARLLNEAVNELEPDERLVFVATLQGIALLTTAQKCGHTVAWARAKLASARLQLGAKVHMWGLGLDKAA